MKYCSKCGEQNPDEAKFCAKCGKPFVDEKKSQVQQEPKPTSKPASRGSANSTSGSSTKTVLIIIAVIIAAIIAIVAISNNSGSSYTPSSNSQSSYTPSSSSYSDNSRNVIDKNRVENIISGICRCTSKGGNYSSLQNYFTYEISPYSGGGERRYSNEIGEKTRNYVERFEEYAVSSPYNFSYVNNSFPLTIKCEVTVTWSKNGKRKRAWIEKTYYVTSDYKVSGFIDRETNRVTLN